MFDQVALWDGLFRCSARKGVYRHPLRILSLLSCCPYNLCDLGCRGLFSPSRYRFDFFHTVDGADYRILAHPLWFITSALKTPAGPCILKEILKISHSVYQSLYSPYKQTEDEFITDTDVFDQDTLKKLSVTFLDSLERRWPGLCPCNGFNMAKVHRYRNRFASNKSPGFESWAPSECFNKGVICSNEPACYSGDFQFDAGFEFSEAGTIPSPTNLDGELWRQSWQSAVMEHSTLVSHAMPTEAPFDRQHNAMDYEKSDTRRQGDKPARERSPSVQISALLYALVVALGAMALLAIFDKASRWFSGLGF